MKFSETIIKTRLASLFVMLFCGLWTGSGCLAVTVTMLTDKGAPRPIAVGTAERNLGVLLTEINRAQKANTILTTSGLPMNDFALKSLLRIWAVTPFYCEKENVVDRVWVFKNGTMMMSHVPLRITPDGDTFGSDEYQEAVVEFDKRGNITDFRFALDSHKELSMESPGLQVVNAEERMIILKTLERFRTAYNQKDIATIEQMFSDDALIITGNVVMQKQSELMPAKAKVVYTQQSKVKYITNLRKAFRRNKWINVQFSGIGDDGGDDGYGISKSKIDPTKYGVCLRQEWRSSNYSDTGYLFLLWEFPKNGGSPIIHVRTWQPELVGGKKAEPAPEISTLGGFDL